MDNSINTLITENEIDSIARDSEKNENAKTKNMLWINFVIGFVIILFLLILVSYYSLTTFKKLNTTTAYFHQSESTLLTAEKISEAKNALIMQSNKTNIKSYPLNNPTEISEGSEGVITLQYEETSLRVLAEAVLPPLENEASYEVWLMPDPEISDVAFPLSVGTLVPVLDANGTFGLLAEHRFMDPNRLEEMKSSYSTVNIMRARGAGDSMIRESNILVGVSQ